jgi:tetratricopeptide (TPR) repeat protein
VRSLVLTISLLAAACGWGDDTRPGRAIESRELAPIGLPELSRVDAPVQAQIRDKYTGVTRLESAGTRGRELGEAYGAYGMVLHAAEYLDAAEPAYRNAERLMPEDVRWPYYLAHLYRIRGDTDRAIASFRRALELRPDESAALVWLGRMLLDRGEPGQAEPLFARAQAIGPNLAAQVGLGQAALARKDYARAAQALEAALAFDPGAASVYSPLAIAYRGLGQTEKAESLASQWRNTDVPVVDPLRNELDMAVESGLAYELRGVRALDSRDFASAADLFRKGLALAPEGTTLSRSLRHKLGTALALAGQTQEAMHQFEETIRRAPRNTFDEPGAKACYSLGLLLASTGQPMAAVERLNAAIQFNPNYFEARLALGDLLSGAGRPQAALPHYADALRINPRAAEARYNYAVALVQLRRYVEARAWLEEGVRAQPDRPELANGLARLLAAAPDPKVRDGQRALAIAEQLAASIRSTDVGETLAMALAETGSFTEAAAVQRDVMAAASSADPAARARLQANLRLYESGRPSRTPY